MFLTARAVAGDSMVLLNARYGMQTIRAKLLATEPVTVMTFHDLWTEVTWWHYP